ncbi:MAG: fibronectin type III domain-containing protein, partial [Bacteroidota bacterium]|nr:fibronectin type III domain-containing protein [Bacteroidota bacterium]
MKTKEHIPKKKFKILYLIILLIISQINSYAQLASLTSVASAGITKTTATGFSFITDEGGSAVTDRGMCWSTNNPPTILDNITSDGAGIGGFISDLTVLTPNTTYYIRSYATNGSGTAYGNVITIHTLSDSPELTTTAITGITNTGCASGGTVSSPGTYSAVLSEGVCWNRSGSPTLKNMDGNTSDGAITPFTSNPSGLMPSTVYYLCAYAINGTDTAYGNVLSFTTLGTPPLLSTNAITGITSSGCTSGGNITAWGGSNITDRGVCWGTSTGPLSSGSHTSDGTGTGSYTSNPASLTPNTLYYLRSFAVNSTSTAYGNELTFTTKNTPPTGLNVTSLSYDGFIANWTAPAGIGSEPYTYTIRVYNNSGCTGAPIRTFSGISSSLTSYQITYLKFNTSYWYVMRTINAGGESDSITSSTTTLAANLYKGGSEDGFEIGNYYTPLSFCFIPLFTDAYYGGTGDGSVINNKIIKNCPYSYYGGSEDGYIESDYTTPTTLCQPIDFNSVYLGGSDDGFVNKNSIVIKCPYFYYGGNEDGYLESDYSITNCPVPNFTSAYYGGSEDGFIDNNLTLKRCPYNYYGGSEDGIDVFSVGQINCPPPVFTNVYFGGNEDGFIDNNLTLKRCPYNYYGGSEDGLAVFSVKPACLPTVDFNTALNCADQTVTYTTNCTGIPTCPPSKYSPTYSWTFNGGNPSSYTGATPPTVTYTTTGTFT